MKVTLIQLTCLYQFARVMGVSVIWTFLVSAGRKRVASAAVELAAPSISADDIVASGLGRRIFNYIYLLQLCQARERVKSKKRR